MHMMAKAALGLNNERGTKMAGSWIPCSRHDGLKVIHFD